MPVDIVDIDFGDADFSTISTGVDYLNGSIGDKLTAEITFDIHWETPVDTPMSLSTFGLNRIDRYDGGSFIADGFKNGDDILVSLGTNVLAPITILGTFADHLNISSGLSAVSPPQEGIIYGVTPVQNLDYYYGIVENVVPNSTISLIDGSIQKYKSGTIVHTNTTPSPILPDTTINSWVYDLADQNSTIEGLGALIDINKQRFKITHEFHIQPVFRTQDLNSSGNLVTPSFLANTKSLKYTLKIDARYTTTGTNVEKSTSNGNILQFIKSGDVGYFDENGNGGTPDYTLASPITYRDTLTNAVVDSILPNTETDVTIVLNSASGAFSNINTKFIVHIYRTPNDASVYENTTSDIKENFLVSRQSLKINDVPTVSGNGFIKAGATAVYNGDIEAVINFTFEPTFFLSQDNVLNDLSAFNNDPANTSDGYLIFVTCQDKTITNKGLSDKVAVLCDVNTAAGIELEDFYNTDGVCTTTTLFNDHPTNNELLAFTDYKGWLEDSVVAKANIQVLKTNDQQGIGNNLIQNVWNLNNVTLKIEAEHKTDPTRFFALEESKKFIAGVDEIITRDFILPIGAPQNEIIWSQAASTATHNVFNLVYPFKIRWEDWKVLFGVDNDFTGNNDWVQYINSDWDIKVNVYNEVDLAQDLQASPTACDWTVNLSGKDVEIIILTASGSLTHFEDNLNNVTQIGTNFIYSIANDVNRDITAKIGNCLPDVETLRIWNNDSKIQGFLDLTGFTNLDFFELQGQSGVTSLQLPASGGTSLNIASNSDLFTADLSGFTGLDSALNSFGRILIRWNYNLDSVVLPTVAVAPTFSFILLNNNALTSLDLTPVIQSLAATPQIDVRNNLLNSADIDQIIIDVDSQSVTNGVLKLENQTPAAPPTGASATELANLVSNGWDVTTD